MRNCFLNLGKFFLFGCLIATINFGSACTAQESPIKVAGVQVVGEGYGKNDYGVELRPFNWPSGTTVSLLFQHKPGGLIAIDTDSSKVSKWVDSNNQNVMTKKSNFSGKTYEFKSATISEDGKAAIMEITTEAIPKKGTTGMVISGELHLASGSKTETLKSATIPVTKGEKFKLSGLDFKVTAAGKPEWGEDPFSIKLTYKGDASKIKEIKLFDANGKQLEFNDLGTMTSGFDGNVQVSKEMGFKKKLGQIIVGVESWSDRRVSKVPFKLNVSFGL